ncbi:MAG: hypothetical protein RMM06_10500, partial [Armatimonadota bacterium]|nr:hypothetical protein [Armatimonadota bacterium]
RVTKGVEGEAPAEPSCRAGTTGIHPARAEDLRFAWGKAVRGLWKTSEPCGAPPHPFFKRTPLLRTGRAGHSAPELASTFCRKAGK